MMNAVCLINKTRQQLKGIVQEAVNRDDHFFHDHFFLPDWFLSIYAK